ncbi:hypothetical protein E3N88_19292 [Mikania micrantha]|uniref:Uncharacterized protein n=1 Tax=Mikania micrantha TaxID=192012 RepID=A0A5N6NMR9_9ASTR|nr:hypothetical protein E3N88_19292 [Mikania micrantha]
MVGRHTLAAIKINRSTQVGGQWYFETKDTNIQNETFKLKHMELYGISNRQQVLDDPSEAIGILCNPTIREHQPDGSLTIALYISSGSKEEEAKIQDISEETTNEIRVFEKQKHQVTTTNTAALGGVLLSRETEDKGKPLVQPKTIPESREPFRFCTKLDNRLERNHLPRAGLNNSDAVAGF